MFRPRAGFDLFLISALILFLELACIRWFPAHVVFLSFFTNTVLLACFVGMSIGCLTARSARRHLNWTPVVLAVSLVIGLTLYQFSSSLSRIVNVGNQSKGDVIFFGAETTLHSESEFLVPVELVAGAMFLLIAAIMIGPGQEMGRAFNRVPNRVRAYTMNLLGSLVGIALFALSSWLHLPPVVWFSVVALGLLYFFARRDESDQADATPISRLLFPAVCLLCAVMLSLKTSGIGSLFNKNVDITWSPYYRVTYRETNQFISTNLIGHQGMISREKPGNIAYHLPHLLHRSAAKPPLQRVLIIGAGSGNDVSRALLWTNPDVRIDAVDIEPVIQKLGRQHHPDQPYSDPRVTMYLNDGRNFLRQAPEAEYDLVIYALVDSLVLHSGYGNIRLESYLFTDQAFKDVKRALKPDGTFAVYNFFRSGWVVARLRNMLRDTFGSDPLAFTDPPADAMKLDYFGGMHTFFLAGSPDSLQPIRTKFTENNNRFWVPLSSPVTPTTPVGFGLNPPANDLGADTKWSELRLAQIEETNGELPLATDVWPFFYTRQPTLPGYLLRGMAIMLGLAGLLWFAFRPRGADAEEAKASARQEAGLLLRMFLLGAGFMLVETKAVVHMALLFGSTWMVNTVVFFALLSVALLANLFVLRFQPKNLSWAYAGLLLTLGLNLAVPLDAFLGLDRAVQIVASCALVFAPIFFAGTIFATSFQRTQAPDRAFGANVAGALVGGLSENLSMLLGFQFLLIIAIAYYLISGIGGSKAIPSEVSTPEGV